MRVRVEQALGPRASVGSLVAGGPGSVITDLRVRHERPLAGRGRAARGAVVVVPELSSVFRDAWRVRLVRVERLRIAAAQARRELQMVPTSCAPKAKPERTSRAREHRPHRAGRRRRRVLRPGVRRPPHRMRFERLNAELEDLALPALDQPVAVALRPCSRARSATATSPPATWCRIQDGQLNLRLTGVDLIALEPYLLKVHEAGVRRGTLDLTLDAKVAPATPRPPGSSPSRTWNSAAGGGLVRHLRQGAAPGRAGEPRPQRPHRLSSRSRAARRPEVLGQRERCRCASPPARKSLGVGLGGVVEGWAASSRACSATEPPPPSICARPSLEGPLGRR